MKIELSIQELLQIIDMIRYGENNEGDDFYMIQDFVNGTDTKPKCVDCGSTDEVLLSATKGFNAYCKKCLLK